MTHLTFLQLQPSPESHTDLPAAKKHFEATKSLMTALAGVIASTTPGHHNHSAISLELVAKSGSVSFVLAVPAHLQHEVTQHLYAALPTAHLEVLPNWQIFDTPGQLAGATLQFDPPQEALLSTEFAGADPLRPLLELLSDLAPTDRLCIQLILAPSGHKPGLAAALLNGVGDLMLGTARALLTSTPAKNHDTHDPHNPADPHDNPDHKHHTAPFAANLRAIALSNTTATADGLIRRAAAAFHQLAVPGKTKLRYHQPKHLRPWLTAALERTPDPTTSFLLTPAEAANLYHTPLSPRAVPRLDTQASTHLPIPEHLPTAGLLVGHGAFRSQQAPVRLAPQDRLRHTYLIGQTGTGKSTLFQNAILQDMQAGEGCAFIDPHGEAIDWLLPRIPAHRAQDVILFDPSDPQALLGLNLLEWRTPHERDLLIQELILLFYKLFDPQHTGIIGPQFEHWLRNAALTITEPAIRGTLVDIPRLFTDPDFAKAMVARSDHWAVKDFWNNQMARTADFHKSEMLNYFTSKFGSFLGNTVMHQILSTRRSAFNLRTLMDRRKILLVNLSKGKLGSLNAQLLGALIMTKIQMAAMSRADTPQDQRPPFYVYIDEFQNIVTDSFAAMLSEIRKYGVGLHLAHQYVDQLPEPVKQAIVGNVGTLMAFRLGRADADWLAPHFTPLSADDLTNIQPFHYHLRTLAHGQLTTPFTVAAPQLQTTPQPALEQALRSRVRQFVAATRT